MITSISSFSQLVFYAFTDNYHRVTHVEFGNCRCLHFDKSKISLFGKEFIHILFAYHGPQILSLFQHLPPPIDPLPFLYPLSYPSYIPFLLFSVHLPVLLRTVLLLPPSFLSHPFLSYQSPFFSLHHFLTSSSCMLCLPSSLFFPPPFLPLSPTPFTSHTLPHTLTFTSPIPTPSPSFLSPFLPHLLLSIFPAPPPGQTLFFS